LRLLAEIQFDPVATARAWHEQILAAYEEMDPFVRKNIKHRSDLSEWLVHFTQGTSEDAGKTLAKIIEDGCLVSSTTVPVICFTEAPLNQFQQLFTHVFSAYRKARLAPYGVAVRKRWAFEHGGRPVIYGPPNEKDLLPASMRWRHVDFTPEYDFMWMREWRIPTARMELDPTEALVVVPNEDAAWGLTHEMGQELEYDGPGEYISADWSWRDWFSFSLDQLDKSEGNADEVISKSLERQKLDRRDKDEEQPRGRF